MAMNSTKSSSSGRSNPDSRASELTDPMRRSFAANPFVKPSLIPNPNPRTTPSDFPRRNPVGGREGAAGSFFRDVDDKENAKDSILKPWKARSPAASSKGAKNFMSPTISASSKVTVSPRKKALVDRNEPARASAPSAAAKSPVRKVTFAEPLHYSDPKSEGEKKFEALSSLDDGVPKEEVHVASSLSCEELCGEAVCDVNVAFDVKDEAGASSETVIDEPDRVNLDPSFKLSPTPTPPLPVSSVVAPLDADPLMPPYDPKTNYLSPRPQFLHYKPKQRIELDDSFVYGSLSDTEVTEDSQSEGSQKESEDVSSDERVEEEQSPVRTAEETVEAKEVPKPCFSMRWKAVIALPLLLSVAFIAVSVTNTGVIDGTVFQDIYGVYESSGFSEFARTHFDQFSGFAKANFDDLSRNFHTWFTKSLSSISELISGVRGVHNLGHLQYCNLTVLHEHNAVDQGPIFGRGKKDIGGASEVYPLVLNVEDSDAASVTETDEDIGDISSEHYDSVYEEQVQQSLEVITTVGNASDDAPESDELLEGQQANVIESVQALQLAEVSEPNHSEVEVQSSLDSVAADIHIEVFNAGNLEAMQPQEDDANVNVHKHGNVGLKDQPGLDSEVAEILTETYGDKDMKLTEAISTDVAAEDDQQRLKTIDLQPRMVLYSLLCGGAVLITGAAFNCSRKGKSRSTRVTSSVEQPLFAKAFHANSLLTPKQEQSYLDKPSLRNGPIEIDMHGESCPSEMSSIQKSLSYRQRLVQELNDEVHSLEKKAAKKRRESLATSSDYSMGSPSYGSFTTYEKIQIKNGHRDGETITPVRRSSRIRSQATSPL